MSIKTLQAKVARRILGFQGMVKAAQDNAARLAERVAALEDAISKQAEVMDALRGSLAQLDQAAQGRMDSIMSNFTVLADRVMALEVETTPEPVTVEPEVAPAILSGDGTAAQVE